MSSKSPARDSTSHSKQKVKKGTNPAKKQTRIDSTNPSGASKTVIEVDKYPNISLNKDFVKELHILEAKMASSNVKKRQVSEIELDYLQEGDQVQLLMYGIYHTALKGKFVMPAHLRAIEYGLQFKSAENL